MSLTTFLRTQLQALLRLLMSQRPPASTASGRTDVGLILIVDDQGTNRTLLLRLLNMLGHSAEPAADGLEALQKWETGKFSLLITDCRMPKLDGYALTRRIRQIESEQNRMRTPIFAWTSTPTPDELARISESGMDGILGKPVDVEALEQLLSERPSSKPPAGPSARKFKTSPSTQVLDESVLARYSGGDRTIELEILAEFDASSRSDIQSVERALSTANPAMVAQYCHRLKGASRMIGASRFATACGQMEVYGRAGNWDDINAYQDDLFDELRKLRVAMESR